MRTKKNTMEMIPKRNSKIHWYKIDGKVVLEIRRQGRLHNFIHKIFNTPLTARIDLEEIGSFIWENCDGENNVYIISQKLEEHFGEKAKPVVERLLQYIRILITNKFLTLE